MALSTNHLTCQWGKPLKGKFSNMAAVLSVNGCAEIENLLKFCEIPREKIRVEEEGEFTSSKVWLFMW